VKLTIGKEGVLKNIQKQNSNIESFDEICFTRSYEIDKALELKDLGDLLMTAIQGGLTGAAGFAGIPFNIVLSTFLYFRAVQNIALYYGYDVQNDPAEMEIAMNITMQALKPNIEEGSKTLSGAIGKMMLMTKTTTLRQGLNKTYAEMAEKGGVQLLYVQIRALANKAAQSALEKTGKKNIEKSVYSEMLEQLGKHLTKSAGKKIVPIIGGVIGMTYDTAYMYRILKFAKICYHKRFLVEKENRINDYLCSQ